LDRNVHARADLGEALALKATLAGELEASRRRLLDLLEPLPDEELGRQHSPLMSPLVWDLAHAAWYEELWLVRRLAGDEPRFPRNDELYDAFLHPRAERPGLPLLSPAEARAYAAAVRRRALEVLGDVELDPSDPLRAAGFVYGLVVQHEHQHVETMLATLQLGEVEYAFGAPPPRGGPVGSVEALVEGGPFVLGTSDEPWAYDNERPAHEVDLPPFWIDTTPVANRAYAEFVEAGGYRERRWWHQEGWAYRLEAGLEHPDRACVEGNWSSASGAQAIQNLYDQYPEMDAVFVANDQMALSVLQHACRNNISVPDDLGSSDSTTSPKPRSTGHPSLPCTRTSLTWAGWPSKELPALSSPTGMAASRKNRAPS